HGRRDVLHLVLGDPLPDPILREKQYQGVAEIEGDAHDVSHGEIPAEDGGAAAKGGKEVDAHPEPGIRVVQVQVGEPQEGQAKNHIKDDHAHTAKLADKVFLQVFHALGNAVEG